MVNSEGRISESWDVFGDQVQVFVAFVVVFGFVEFSWQVLSLFFFEINDAHGRVKFEDRFKHWWDQWTAVDQRTWMRTPTRWSP